MFVETFHEKNRRYSKVDAPFLAVKFKGGRIHPLQRLLYAEEEEGFVHFKNRELIIQAINNPDEWDAKMGNTAVMSFPFGLAGKNDNACEVSIFFDIESIRLEEDYALSFLFLKGEERIKKANQIIKDCQNLLIREGVSGLFTLSANPCMVHNVPQIEFTLEDCDSNVVSVIILDGFSGRMIIDGVLGDKLYEHPEDFHQIVIRLANAHLEKITANAG